MKEKIKIKNIFRFVILIMISAVLILFTGCEAIDNFIATDENKDNSAKNDNNGEGDSNNNYPEIDPNDIKVEIGYYAPNFTVELLSGEKVKLWDYWGKAILINFWATWCGPCINEMPDIQLLSETYADDLVILGINCSEKKDKVDTFIKDNKYSYYIGLDENGDIQKKYPTQGIPYTIIINPEGIITEIRLGAGDNMFSVYEKYVNDALGN